MSWHMDGLRLTGGLLSIVCRVELYCFPSASLCGFCRSDVDARLGVKAAAFQLRGIPSASLHQAPSAGQIGCLGPILDLELAENIGHVIFDRAFREVKLAGDFLVGNALGEHGQHLLLALG